MSILHGYGKILDVDLSTGEIAQRDIAPEFARSYIGGVGLGARILWDETSATTDPFSAENRLMFMIGPLTGRVPLSSRAAVCCLSPLNNAWGEATMGGTWAAELSNTGLSGIVVSGRAQKPVYLYVKDADVRIEDAGHLWGRDTFETHDRLLGETDKKASAACIGRAGEKLVRMAGIVCDGRFSRIAARCGVGAVMGSKNLKAVVVRGTKKPGAFDEAGLKATTREVTQLLTRIKSGAFGALAEPIDALIRSNEVGTLGVKNQSLGRWDAFIRKCRESFDPGKHLYCRLCQTGCIESHAKEDGRQQVLEMLMPVGANCLIDDLEALQKGYELCNRYGIDTISLGYAISLAMELFEKGIISRQDTGGLDFTWGNHETMLEMVKQIGENESFGEVLGQGTRLAAEKIGGEAPRYAMQVKGLETTHWDPRVYNSLAIGYATGNKGGSHYESPGHAIERRRPEAAFGIDLAEFGYPRGVSPLGFEGKADIARKIQDVVCLINSLVICQFSFQIYGVRIAQYLAWLNAVTGWDMKTGEFLRAGERAFNLKRLINVRRGLTGKDDILPERFLTKLPDIADEKQNVPVRLKEHLQEYYTLRGWGRDGVPTQEKLRELSLP